MEYLHLFWQGLIVLVVIIIIYLFLGWLFKTHTQLSTLSDGKKSTTVAESRLTNSKSTNFCYSSWFFVDDWNYKYGSKKILFSRGAANNSIGPIVALGETENDIAIGLTVYSEKQSFSNYGDDSLLNKDGKERQTFIVKNFPLQRWVNLIISVYNKTLDVYLDGKLVQSNLLKGVPVVDSSQEVYITPDGGFSGWTTNFRYWPQSVNPQEAYDIYKDGYGGSLLGNLFNKYKLKISFLNENVEQGSIEI